MIWYKPKTWFQKSDQKEKKEVIYCDNPQCNKPITDDILAYNAFAEEFYHQDECPGLANAWKAFSNQTIKFMKVSYIDQNKAKELLEEKSNKGLEGKLD
jgi:hypothetical protein